MDQRIKAKWTKALKSGEYKQGFKALNEGGEVLLFGCTV